MSAEVYDIVNGKKGKPTPMKLRSISKEEFMSESPKPSKGAPPSRRTGRGATTIMSTRKLMPMPDMKKIEPLKKIDYEGDFDKAFSASLPSKKKSRQQMTLRETEYNKMTKGMKK